LRVSTATDTVAVIPGISLRSSFLTAMIVLYVTTFWFVTGCRRTCSTLPQKTWSG